MRTNKPNSGNWQTGTWDKIGSSTLKGFLFQSGVLRPLQLKACSGPGIYVMAALYVSVPAHNIMCPQPAPLIESEEPQGKITS